MLIDLTDRRFKIPVNADVIDYIEGANPFAHSDLGQTLIELNGGLLGGNVYCPSFKICAYVLLHDAANAIFAFAADMRDLSFRLPANLHDEILTLGDAKASRIGGEWLDISAFPPGGQTAKSASRITAPRPSAMRQRLFRNPDEGLITARPSARPRVVSAEA